MTTGTAGMSTLYSYHFRMQVQQSKTSQQIRFDASIGDRLAVQLVPAPWAADLRGEARIPHYRHRPQRAGSGRSGRCVVVGGELAPTKGRFAVVPAPAACLACRRLLHV